jgi:hypothetical protein
MDLYRFRWSKPKKDPCAQAFVSLIRFLLDCGSDPNNYHVAETHDESPDIGWHSLGGTWLEGNGTVLDTFATLLMCQEPSIRLDCETYPLVYDILLDNNAYFSRPMTGPCGGTHRTMKIGLFEREVERFKIFEDQHEGISVKEMSIGYH